MAQWIRRLPTEQEILGSSPSTDSLFFSFSSHCRHATQTHTRHNTAHTGRMHTTKRIASRWLFAGRFWEKGGDARIELATSCTRSRNHTTRPITQLYVLHGFELKSEGRAGVEPATYRAATNCSATELTPRRCTGL